MYEALAKQQISIQGESSKLSTSSSYTDVTHVTSSRDAQPGIDSGITASGRRGDIEPEMKEKIAVSVVTVGYGSGQIVEQSYSR